MIGHLQIGQKKDNNIMLVQYVESVNYLKCIDWHRVPGFCYTRQSFIYQPIQNLELLSSQEACFFNRAKTMYRFVDRSSDINWIQSHYNKALNFEKNDVLRLSWLAMGSEVFNECHTADRFLRSYPFKPSKILSGVFFLLRAPTEVTGPKKT